MYTGKKRQKNLWKTCQSCMWTWSYKHVLNLSQSLHRILPKPWTSHWWGVLSESKSRYRHRSWSPWQRYKKSCKKGARSTMCWTSVQKTTSTSWGRTCSSRKHLPVDTKSYWRLCSRSQKTLWNLRHFQVQSVQKDLCEILHQTKTLQLCWGMHGIQSQRRKKRKKVWG